VNQPLFAPESSAFKSFPLLLALQHALPLDVVQLLIRHNAYLLCFDEFLRFPLHYLCQNYIYRIDCAFLRDILNKCQDEITRLNQRYRILNGTEAVTDANIDVSLAMPIPALLQASSITPQQESDQSSDLEGSGDKKPATSTVVCKSLLPQADLGFVPPLSLYEKEFDFALLEPQNVNELINLPPAFLTNNHAIYRDSRQDDKQELKDDECFSGVEYDESTCQHTPLESALIAASKCLFNTDQHYTIPSNFTTNSTGSNNTPKMIEWKDPLQKNQRAKEVVDCLRLLIDHSDNVTAEAIFDFETPEDDTADIIDEDEKKRVQDEKKKEYKLDKAADLTKIAPAPRYPQLHSLHSNPLAVAMDLFSKNTQWGLCILPSLLFQGQTRPKPRRHLTLPTTYRYIMLYYSSLSLPNRPRFNGGLLSALFFHPNPFIHNLFRLGLTKPPTSSDVLFNTSMLHATFNLHRLLTLLQYLPDTMKQEAIFQRLYEQIDAFVDKHSTTNFNTLMIVSQRNPWYGTALSTTAMQRLLTFTDVGNLAYGANSNELIEIRAKDDLGKLTDLPKKYYPALPVNYIFELFKANDETFESTIDPNIAQLFSKQQYQDDIVTPYSSAKVQRVLDTHQAAQQSQHDIFIQWSDFSIFPNKSRIEMALKPTRESCNGDEEEYRKQLIAYRDKNDIQRRTPHEMSRVNPVAQYGPQLVELQSQHQKLCDERLTNHDILSKAIVQTGSVDQFTQLNPLHMFTHNADNKDGDDSEDGDEKEQATIDPYNALTSAILSQYLTILTAWRTYFVENPFIGNIHDEDLFRSPQIRQLLTSTKSIEEFFLTHYPHSYDKFITALPAIDHHSADAPKSRSELSLSTLNPLYASFYNLNPIVTSSIQPFPSANNAPVITLQLLDFISVMSSGAVFKQPTELLTPPSAEQFFGYLHQLLAQQKDLYANRLEDDKYLPDYLDSDDDDDDDGDGDDDDDDETSDGDNDEDDEDNKDNEDAPKVKQVKAPKTQKPKPCLNPVTIPQPGTTVAFSHMSPPGLFWWALYYSPKLSYDDVMLLCQHCRTDILNPQSQSLLMVAIAKHWPLQNLLPLIRSTININQRDLDGRTVLHYYFLTGCYMTVPELLDILVFEYGAVLNIIDAHGNSPLTYAIYTQAPQDVLIKLLNYTLLRTPAQYEKYYQFFEPESYLEFTNAHLNPAPHFSQLTTYTEPKEDDEEEDEDEIEERKEKQRASSFTPPIMLRSFLNQDHLDYYKNRATLTVQQFYATMNGLSVEKRDEILKGSNIPAAPGADVLHTSCNIPKEYFKYLNCPINVNYLTHTTYANDTLLPIIVVDSDLVSNTHFSAGIIPNTQFSSHTVECRRKSVLSGGYHSDEEAMTSGLFLTLHEIMLRCHTPWPVIQHLVALTALGLSVSGAWNPNNDKCYTYKTPREQTLEELIASLQETDEEREKREAEEREQKTPFDKTTVSVPVHDAEELRDGARSAIYYLFRQLPKRTHQCEEIFETLYNLVGPGAVSSVSAATPIPDRVVYGVNMLWRVDDEFTQDDPNKNLGDDFQDESEEEQDDDVLAANLEMHQSRLKQKQAKQNGLTKMTRDIFIRRYTKDMAGTCEWTYKSIKYGIDQFWVEWKAQQTPSLVE
jgi:hypothetical protein